MTFPDLYEAICTKDTPAGRISLHVPVIKLHGCYFNANTGNLEPWVKSAEPMADARRMMFEVVAQQAEAEAKVRARLERSA